MAGSRSGAQSASNPRRSRICCLIPRVGFWVRGSHHRRGEVAGERRVGFDGDDPVVLGPDLREQGEDQPASLGGLVLGVPEAREVFEDGLCAIQVWVGWRLRALQLLLQHLAAHRVLGLGDVAHDVEVA